MVYLHICRKHTLQVLPLGEMKKGSHMEDTQWQTDPFQHTPHPPVTGQFGTGNIWDLAQAALQYHPSKRRYAASCNHSSRVQRYSRFHLFSLSRSIIRPTEEQQLYSKPTSISDLKPLLSGACPYRRQGQRPASLIDSYGR